MSHSALLLAPAVLAFAGYWVGKRRSPRLFGGGRGTRQLHSLPSDYGFLPAQRTSAAISVLLAFAVVMNATAVVRCKRFEQRW
jgi:hypothetical protein